MTTKKSNEEIFWKFFEGGAPDKEGFQWSHVHDMYTRATLEHNGSRTYVAVYVGRPFREQSEGDIEVSQWP